MGFEKNYLIWT